jgi:putative transposase
MPRRPRAATAGVVFHVVNRGARRGVLFEDSRDYTAFEDLLGTAVARGNVALFAYCLMPNHWHLLLSPEADGALSRFMHWLTTTHARRWQTHRGMDGQGAVYQGRFKAIPVASDHHFLWVCRYVERNPLRASLVDRAEEWRWSSLRYGDGRPEWLSAWPVARPSDWSSQVDTPQTQAELDAFRRAARAGEPFGNDEWKRTMMMKMGKPVRTRGRPRRRLDECPLKMTPDPLFTSD